MTAKTKVPDPTVGRIVHYTPDQRGPLEIQAAIVTRIRDGNTVALLVFDAGDDDCVGPTSRSLASVEYTGELAGTEEARGCWTWPVY